MAAQPALKSEPEEDPIASLIELLSYSGAELPPLAASERALLIAALRAFAEARPQPPDLPPELLF